MSIPEAATALGVSANTVRAMIKRGEVRAQRIRRPQGWTYRVVLDGEVPAAGTTATSASTSAEVPAASTYQPPTNDLQRAEALAAYGATLLAPVLAELEVIRCENRDLARENGQLRAQLAAAELIDDSSINPPCPWWRFWRR
jgi:excisionase family DNA binding protein